MERGFADSLVFESITDDGVVDEFAEDGERPLVSELFCVSDGVADTEAEAKTISEDDFHSVLRFVTQSKQPNFFISFSIFSQFFLTRRCDPETLPGLSPSTHKLFVAGL